MTTINPRHHHEAHPRLEANGSTERAVVARPIVAWPPDSTVKVVPSASTLTGRAALHCWTRQRTARQANAPPSAKHKKADKQLIRHFSTFMNIHDVTSSAHISQSSVNADLRTKLLPPSVAKTLPPLGSTEGENNPMALARFFTPDAGWTWWVLEFDGADTFYGLVDGLDRELGTFSLSELLSVRGSLGLPVERDLYFDPTPLSKL